MTTKQFHLGDLMSISEERLVSPNGMDGIYDILNHITGDNLSTHALERATDWAKPHLIKHFPFLTEDFIVQNLEGINADNYQEKLKILTDKYGEYHNVQGPINGWLQKNPITEAAELMSKK